jgi:dihydropyrimidine dehydrogenase (NAD+) subunit PreT
VLRAAGNNFSDLHPLLEPHEAQVEADRCYFCYDAPCMHGLPDQHRHSDVHPPDLDRQSDRIGEDDLRPEHSRRHVRPGLPDGNLCEQVCVREVAEGKPVKIGQLQRYATDHYMAAGEPQFFTRGADRQKGRGGRRRPGRAACAHRLAMHGHDVTLFDAREKAGGLNEYGIASYKSSTTISRPEVDFILSIGGISSRPARRLGDDLDLDALRASYDAVFLGIGLGGVNALGLDGEDKDGSLDAVDYIADLRQADDLPSSGRPPGRRHRRRHDGGRHRRSDQAARRR